MLVSNAATIAENGTLPTPTSILKDKNNFIPQVITLHN